ncbi:NrsF family protein [Rhodopseudomonas pseudopalustris]|uniref:DUF1109 domain-containing protein n=2 Tax=Rhodopseudomonas TaxID=1073 RepID=Q130J8_RHOPS|nr:DUF1109 domain-containing protein [Rhodopseudomonas pseudopalustris]ABE41491.1 protein of unknown function DUF1109 [Rhodopseudomonas palustris BisB5]SEO07565.1 hypothetical protein SAMN05444123_101184 [Rhodopseudomonas pseudopalustris]
MKTDDLIAMLGTNVEPVRRPAGRTLVLVIAGGVLLAACLVLAVMGLRPDLDRSLPYLLLKIGLMLPILIPASIVLSRLARPGGERRVSLALLSLPLLAVMGLAIGALSLTPMSHWRTEIVGDEWIECLVSIPVIAIVPFATIIWAVRRMAPTDLVRAGAVSGLVAGCVSAMGYALHCAAESVAFISVWYGGTVVLCTLAGALLGPRLLRW